MAKKKAAGKKKQGTPKTPGYSKTRPCNPPEICKFLEELTVWLTFMETDYEKLRIAVCNVEAKAFDGLGVSNKRFCPPGPGGDPPPPPPPPKW